MPFDRPSLAQLKERAMSEYAAKLGLDTKQMRRSVAEVLATQLAGSTHSILGYLDWIARQTMPDTAETAHLERWASIWGVLRKAAAFAEGYVDFNGDGVVPSGTILKRASDGVLYVTTADGLKNVPVKAQEAGEAHNAVAGETLNLINPISGIQSNATVLSLDGGYDAESDDSLRARLMLRIQKPPQGGAEHDFERWALEVPGVTRAWVYPAWQGLGTVGIAFVRDGDENIFPTEIEVTRVQDYLNEQRPVTAVVFVFAPTPKSIPMTIQLSPSDEITRNAVLSELDTFFQREAAPGKTIYRSRIQEAISWATGEEHHELILPSTDVAMLQNEMGVLGDVKWQ